MSAPFDKPAYCGDQVSQQPVESTPSSRASTFDPPKYEADVNYHLRNFKDPEAQHGSSTNFDYVRDAAPTRKRMSRRTWIAFAALTFVLALGIVVVTLLLSMPGKRELQAPSLQAEMSGIRATIAQGPIAQTAGLHSGTTTTTTVTTSSVTVTATVAMDARSTEQSSSASPSTTTTEVLAASTFAFSPLSSFSAISTGSSISASTTTSSKKTATGNAAPSIQTIQDTSTTNPASSSASSSTSIASSSGSMITSISTIPTAAPSTAGSASSNSPPSVTKLSNAAASPSIAHVPGGMTLVCSVPGSSCNFKRMEMGIEQGGEDSVAVSGQSSKAYPLLAGW